MGKTEGEKVKSSSKGKKDKEVFSTKVSMLVQELYWQDYMCSLYCSVEHQLCVEHQHALMMID